MNCENCNCEHDGKYGSGRFCSQKCARGFSTKNNRKETNKKVSEKLRGRKPSLNNINKRKSKKSIEKQKISIAKHYYEEWQILLNLPWEEFIKHRKNKVYLKKKILFEQNNKCITCGIENWLSKPISLQLHHKDGDSRNNERENLIVICPNCHSQTENYGSKNLISYRKVRYNKRFKKHI